MVGEHTLLLIILSTLLPVFGVACYTLGKLRRVLAARANYIRKLQEHERIIRANRALIEAIAKNYEPAEQSSRRHHCHLPDGWDVYG